jgi:hypothetical protein
MNSQGFDISEACALTEAAGDPRVAPLLGGIDRTAGRHFKDFGLGGGGAALSVGSIAWPAALAWNG